MDTRDIYASHPLSRASILARVARQGVAEDQLSEWHLAVDPVTDLTDQNHPCGVQAVLELASVARITGASVVADVGSGLAGSARVLAATTGCRVYAIERDPGRHDDAAALTQAVHLAGHVIGMSMDAQSDTGGLREVDVLWGQSAWVHFASPEQFLDMWLPTLKRTGRIVLADSHVSREPRTESERALVSELELAWGAHLTPIDRWIGHVARSGFDVVYRWDHTVDSLQHFKALQRVSLQWPTGLRTESEAASWRYAIAAIECGLIQSERLVFAR